MFENFTRTEIKTSGARIVTLHGGKGPPLLLLHGNPFSHLSWQKFAPRLAEEFTVIATDLRGYGDSEKPPGGEKHSNYSFRAMAQDQIEVMAALGYSRFYAAGHDRGARVLHRMCLDHPDKVARAAILDIIPQHHLFNNMTKAWATFSWHWFFMIQPYDFPEHLMSADPDFFIEKKLAKTEQGLSFFDPRALAEYKRYMRNPATVHAMSRITAPPKPSTSPWTPRISTPGARSPVRCCCCGARPAASAAITSLVRAKSGSATRPTSAAPKHCRAAITFRRKRRRKPTRSSESSLQRENWKRANSRCSPLPATKWVRPFCTRAGL